jgi:germacradienol/geosmin synthase
MDPDSQVQFRQAVRTMTASWLWELANQIQNRVPDPVDYLEMRRRTFGSDLTMSLCRLALGPVVPPAVYRTRTVRGLDNTAADYACLVNDVFSYQKEIEFEGELHNGVLVVQRFLDCSREEALDLVNRLMTERIVQFERIVATELPVVYADFGLDEAARDAVDGYVAQLRDWMSGVLLWHRMTSRYDEAELRRAAPAPVPARRAAPLAVTFRGPTGLGTTAARVVGRGRPAHIH